MPWKVDLVKFSELEPRSTVSILWLYSGEKNRKWNWKVMGGGLQTIGSYAKNSVPNDHISLCFQQGLWKHQTFSVDSRNV